MKVELVLRRGVILSCRSQSNFNLDHTACLKEPEELLGGQRRFLHMEKCNNI